MTAGSRPLCRDETYAMQESSDVFDKFDDVKLDPTIGGDLDNIQLNDLASFETPLLEPAPVFPKAELRSSPPNTSPVQAVTNRYISDYMAVRPPTTTIGYSNYEAMPDHGWTTAPSSAQGCQNPFMVDTQPRMSNNFMNPFIFGNTNSPPVCTAAPVAAYNQGLVGKAHSFPNVNVHTPTTMAQAQIQQQQQQQQQQQYVAYEAEWTKQQDPMAQVNGAIPGNFSPVYPEPPVYPYGCQPLVVEERERSSSYPSPWSNSVFSPVGQQGGAYCPSNYSSPPHSLTDLSVAAPVGHPTMATTVCHSGMASSTQSLYTTAGHDAEHAPALHSHSFPGCGPTQAPYRPLQAVVSTPSSPLSASRETSPLTFNTSEWNEVMADPPKGPPPLVNAMAAVSLNGRNDSLFDFRDVNSRSSSLSPNGDHIQLPQQPRSQSVRSTRRPSNSNRRTRNRNGPRSARSLELWQFLFVVLTERAGAGALMWLDQSSGLFKVIDQERLSELWSDSKRRHRDRPKLTRYSNLTRTLRYYYGRNILRKGERDHVYQFVYDFMDSWIATRNTTA